MDERTKNECLFLHSDGLYDSFDSSSSNDLDELDEEYYKLQGPPIPEDELFANAITLASFHHSDKKLSQTSTARTKKSRRKRWRKLSIKPTNLPADQGVDKNNCQDINIDFPDYLDYFLLDSQLRNDNDDEEFQLPKRRNRRRARIGHDRRLDHVIQHNSFSVLSDARNETNEEKISISLPRERKKKTEVQHVAQDKPVDFDWDQTRKREPSFNSWPAIETAINARKMFSRATRGTINRKEIENYKKGDNTKNDDSQNGDRNFQVDFTSSLFESHQRKQKESLANVQKSFERELSNGIVSSNFLKPEHRRWRDSSGNLSKEDDASTFKEKNFSRNVEKYVRENAPSSDDGKSTSISKSEEVSVNQKVGNEKCKGKVVPSKENRTHKKCGNPDETVKKNVDKEKRKNEISWIVNKKALLKTDTRSQKMNNAEDFEVSDLYDEIHIRVTGFKIRNLSVHQPEVPKHLSIFPITGTCSRMKYYVQIPSLLETLETNYSQCIDEYAFVHNSMGMRSFTTNYEYVTAINSRYLCIEKYFEVFSKSNEVKVSFRRVDTTRDWTVPFKIICK